MKKRLLSILLTFIMILNVAPVTVSADEVSENTYATEFYGHSAQLNSFKLYTYADGTKGTTDLLTNVADSDESYTQKYVTSLAAGDYWVEGYDTNGDCSGGMKITVEAKELNTFKIYRAYMIKAANSGWVLGTDYTVSAEVSTADKSVIRELTMGTAKDYNNNDLPSYLCLEGDTVKITYTPSEARVAEKYIETFKSQTMTANNSSWSVSIPQGVDITFVAPEDSTISAGRFHDYYVYDFAEPTAVKTLEDGRVSYTFTPPKGTDWFYRVQNDRGVTYWNYAKWSAETTVEITETDLAIGNADFTKDTIYKFEKNIYDRADIYLNINGKGYMDMDVNDTYQLNVFRNWMAIESINNAKVALPDMHYEVYDVNGNKSDILSITADENNSSVATMKANAEGTAIVLVTYDAMTHMQGMGGKQFSAIWPECTGVFVVSVGADGSSIETNMLTERYETADTALDAEHDILFYLGDAGAEYAFTPEEGSSVSVLHPTLTETSMTYSGGFTTEDVAVDTETGKVTLSGLTTGRHIVKVEKDGKATYQVITARGVSYEMQDSSGNALTEEQIAALKAGDTVYLQFNNLVNPAEKLSGAYNFNASILYYGEDETSFRSKPGSVYGVYDFSGNPVRQNIEIKIPKYWDGSTYTLNGAIKMGGFGNVSVGGHRGVTYAKGLNPNFDAATVGMILSEMPEVTFNLAPTNFLTGTLTFKDQNGNLIDSSKLTVSLKDTDGNILSMKADGTFQCLAEEYSYAVYGEGVEYKTGSLTVTEETKAFEITLQSISEKDWDGTSTAEPAVDENGVYQIGTGAELAWFAQSVNSGNTTISAKLTDDISLSHYPWTAIGANANRYTGTFDGNGHKVEEMYISTSTSYQGFFGYIGAGACIKNLTVEGELTASISTGYSAYVGGLAGYAYGNSTNPIVFENCINNVEITSTTNKGHVAGVVSYANYTMIKNCANIADITTNKANNVAGITGYAYEGSITGCYNTGNISGGGNTAGVVGNNVGSATITACYNTGSITGTSSYVGGLAGYVQASGNVTDCYSTGTLNYSGTATNYVGNLIGYNTAATVTRCYELAEDYNVYGTVLTEEEMKSPELDPDYYVYTCGGYPVLVWQEGVSLHDGVVIKTIAPNCTEKGYTVYTCSECMKSYKSNYVNPLGHNWCTHENDDENCTDCVYTAPTCTEDGSIVRNCKFEDCEELHTDLLPALGHTEDEEKTVEGNVYKDCVCAVCEESYRVWDDDRMAYMEGIGDYAKSASVEDAEYPWAYNEEKTRLESTNVGKNSTTSKTSLAVTPSTYTTFSFNYGVSSESRYDKFTITATVGEETVKIADAISGSNSSTFKTNLVPGMTYTLAFAYTKDSSSASGEDKAWVSDIVFAVTETDVIAMIDAIGEVTIENGDAAIVAARAGYDSLTEEQKALVTNYETLTAAETEYEELEVANVEAIIAGLGEVTLESKEALKEARDAYAALSEEQKKAVDNYTELVKAESGYNALKAEAEKKAAEEAAAKAEAEKKAAEEVLKKAEEEAAKAEAEKKAAEEAATKAEADKNATSADKEAANKALEEANKALEEALKAKEAALIAAIGETDVTLKNASNTSIKVTWDKLSGADGYVIYRAVKGGKFELIKTISSKKTVAYTDKGLKCGTTYVYKIQGFKNVDDEVVYGEMSDEESLKAKPVATKITSLKKGKKKVTIKWKKVSGASGYVIYRATKKNGTYKKVKTIKKVSTVKWTNKKLKSKKTYYYKVRAYKTVNGKKVYSDYSAVKSVKTK